MHSDQAIKQINNVFSYQWRASNIPKYEEHKYPSNLIKMKYNWASIHQVECHIATKALTLQQ